MSRRDDHAICREYLRETRRDHPDAPKILHVDGSRFKAHEDLWCYVYVAGQKQPVEVTACCRWEARAKAIERLMDPPERL